METYIAILRGINVSGRNMIKMDALRNMAEELGFKNVKTYIQSGNIIFKTAKTDCTQIAQTISVKIKAAFSFDVPVLVLTQNELEQIHVSNHFIINQNKDINSLYVTFLSQKPNQSDIDRITGDYGGDVWVYADKAVYLCCPNGYGNTKLTNTFFEKKLKVIATTRNWKTVAELVQIAKGINN